LMRVLLDTNVVLDLLLRRQPWFDSERDLWRALRERRIVGYVTASMVTDIFYIARRLIGGDAAHRAVRDTLAAFAVCTVGRRTLERALMLPGSDYEDNVQIICAENTALDAIITRDPAGFRDATVPVLSPVEAITRLDSPDGA
jgi:predicted nucleic acid-binding protein